MQAVLKSEIPYPRCSFASMVRVLEMHYGVACAIPRVQDIFGKSHARVYGCASGKAPGTFRHCGRDAQTDTMRNDVLAVVPV